MRELSFSRDLYTDAAVEGAVAALGSFGSIERTETSGGWIVRVAGSDPDVERSLAGELANFALGLTVHARRSAP